MEVRAMSTTLSLSDGQQEILVDLLKNTLGDLSYEIADTDSFSYKEQLKERRDELKNIAAQLAE
jgi:hypothetical protein